MPQSTATRDCPLCGLSFRLVSYQNKTYCSRQCSGAARRQPVAPRLWARVDKSDGCWIWRGHTNNNGYGRISVDGRDMLAHRVSWELAYGSVEADSDVLHRCDTPRCVRPNHMFLGNHAANMRDMSEKRRAPIGNRNPMAKLTPEAVTAIRSSRATNAALAVEYGVHPSTISLARSGKNWKYF